MRIEWRLARSLITAVLVLAGLLAQGLWSPEVLSAAARIGRWDPRFPRVDDLLVLEGVGFGADPDSRVISLNRTSQANPGLGEGGISGSSACQVPIVDWSDTRILVLLTGCPPGDYHLWIHTRRGASVVRMALELREFKPPPPVEHERARDMIRAVHPVLARPGQIVDIYGDFPNPDPSTDRLRIQPARVAISALGVAVTVPFDEISRPHMRARLPNRLPAGEYAIFLSRQSGILSTGKRLIVRSTEPRAWEYSSALRYSRPLPYKVVGAVPHVGVERRQMDVLVLHMEGRDGQVAVHLLSDEDLRRVTSGLRNAGDSGAPLYGVPIWMCAVAWSDTRIRVEDRDDTRCGGRLRHGVWNLALRQPIAGRDRWSNAIRIDIPERP